MIRTSTLAQKAMTSLGAEMRNIDDGGRIICQDLQDFTCGHVLQTFARLQNGQRAKQPDGIQSGVAMGGKCCHVLQIIRDLRPVHKDVTNAPRDLSAALVYGSSKPVLGERDVWN